MNAALGVDILIAAVAAYFVWDMVRAYRWKIGSKFQRLVFASKTAAGTMWTGFTVAVTMVVQGLAQLAGVLNAPTVASALSIYGQAKYVAAVMIACAIIIELAARMKRSSS